jgi:hypothetical protein
MTTVCNPPVSVHPVEVVMVQAENWMANAPWWVISAAIHLMLVLAAALVYVERFMPVDNNEVIVTVPTDHGGLIKSELDRPREVFERKGIPKESPESVPSAIEEPSIFFPEAKVSDHHESADGEDYRTMKGDSKEYLSYIRGEGGGFRGRQPGKGPGVYDNIGVGGGGGGGGRYGTRDRGGRENLVNGGGGSQATEGSAGWPGTRPRTAAGTPTASPPSAGAS